MLIGKRAEFTKLPHLHPTRKARWDAKSHVDALVREDNDGQLRAIREPLPGWAFAAATAATAAS